MILIPNCSEAVFRFYTEDPREIQYILKALAEEIVTTAKIAECFDNNDDDFFTMPDKIPLYNTLEEYDTKYAGRYWEKELTEEEQKIINSIEDKRDQWLKKHEIQMSKSYPEGSLLKTLAGLGDNEVIITYEPDKHAIRINIGNNWISDNNTHWIEKIKDLNIQVEEAEFSKELREYARDCCCGIKYFTGYNKLIKDDDKNE